MSTKQKGKAPGLSDTKKAQRLLAALLLSSQRQVQPRKAVQHNAKQTRTQAKLRNDCLAPAMSRYSATVTTVDPGSRPE